MQKLKVFSDGWLGPSESQSIGDDDVHVNLKKEKKKKGFILVLHRGSTSGDFTFDKESQG